MINEENFNTENQKLNNTEDKKPLSQNIVATVALLSLFFGSLGGIFGALYLARLPSVQNYFSKSVSTLPNFEQKVTLTEDSSVIDVVKKASPAVVSIIISKDLSKVPGYGLSPFDFPFPFYGIPQQQPNSSEPNIQRVGAGSGFFVSEDGLILTNRHVVDDEQASYTVLTEDGNSYEAKVLARDPVNDLAIVKIEIKNAPKLILADSSKLEVGQRAVAIGNSLGQYQNTVTTGVVSAIGRSVTAGGEMGSEQLEGVIQTDAAINPGNSGGPLLNVAGQVIGINTAIDREGQLVGFAIPSNDAQKALTSFQKNGKITRAFLGVRYTIISKSLAEKEKLPKDYGALLVRGDTMSELAVVPGSPADKAGLVENDIILEVDGKRVDENSSLSRLLRDHNVGDTVNLKVYHRGEEKTVSVKLEESK